ncbi:FCR3 [Candida margitis]|uniref:FCR3 n=1 Tax=Candida margitis TaxID=1775924 RepID=UPI002226ADF1|nr:FCR3 [Candida margitis]KAI5967957.1 FCR3 [Candida margitis]
MSFNTQGSPVFWNNEQYSTPNLSEAKQEGGSYSGVPEFAELNQENINLFNQKQNDPCDSFQAEQNQYNQANFEHTNNSFALQEQQIAYSSSQNGFPYQNVPPLNSTLSQNSQGNISYASADLSPNQINNNHITSPGTSETSAGYDIDKKVLSDQANGHKKKTKRQLLDEEDAILIARDDSELTDEELQMKRKAQNRAAQRAFRERKETKLKELEAKLLQSEEERQKLVEQLEAIRKQNLSICTENEILRTNEGSLTANKTTVDKFHFPQTQDDFIDEITRGTNHQVKKDTINKVYNNPEGDKLLALGAVWDYLQIKVEEANLDLSTIDFNEVMDRLKGNEKCHGYGPAYPLSLVQQAVEASFK